MWKLLIVSILCSMCFACSQEQQVNQVVVELQEIKNAPKFTKNSDNSKTYFSGLTVCAEDIPSKARPHSCFGNKSTIELYAVGNSFVGFDEESLVINSLTVNNIDISKDRKLNENTELGSFPKTSADGEFASWSIDIKNGYHSIKDNLKFSGYVVAIKSDNFIELRSELFDINNFESFKLGTILVQGTRASSKGINENFKDFSDSEKELLVRAIKKSAELGENPTEEQVNSALRELGIDENKLTELVGNVFEYIFLQAFSPSEKAKSSDEISLRVKTDFSTLDRIELYDGETKIKSSGYFGRKDERAYSFKKPMQSNLTLKVYYWGSPEHVKLNFDF